MTHQEFTDRVKMRVSADEYAAIEVVYMNSDLEKDDFCKVWVRMNRNRIAKYRKEERAKQARAKFISGLHSTMLMFRYEADKANNWNASAERLITPKVLALFDKAGIEAFEFSHVDYKTHCKTLGTLVYEMQEYINNK